MHIKKEKGDEEGKEGKEGQGPGLCLMSVVVPFT